MTKKTKIQEVGEYLKSVQKKSVTGLSEGTATDGGNLVGGSVTTSILSPDFAIGTIYERCKIFNVGANANSVSVPVVSCAKLDDISIRGGVNAYWLGEGYDKTVSSGKVGVAKLDLNPLAVIVPVTDELNQDVENLGAFVAESAEQAIRYKIDSAIIYGDDNQLNGILNTGNQSTGYLSLTGATVTEIESMVKSYYGGENGVWVVSKAAYNDILTGFQDSTNLYFEDGKVYLYGYEVKISPVMRSKDIVLGDFSQYVIGQKEIRETISNSARYLNDESLYRFVIRINGDSSWMQGVTLGDATSGQVTGTVSETATTITAATTGRTATGTSAGFTALPTYMNGTIDSSSKAISGGTVTFNVSSGRFYFNDAATMNGTLTAYRFDTKSVVKELETTITTDTSGYSVTGNSVTFFNDASNYYDEAITQGSFNLWASGLSYHFVDATAGVLSSNVAGISGTINYNTGDWKIDMVAVAELTVGTDISGSYIYTGKIAQPTMSGSMNLTAGTWSLDMSANTLNVGATIVDGYGYSYDTYITGGANSIQVYPFVTNKNY